jgi:hypothetical protein
LCALSYDVSYGLARYRLESKRIENTENEDLTADIKRSYPEHLPLKQDPLQLPLFRTLDPLYLL